MQADPDIIRLIMAVGWVILAFGIYYLFFRRLSPAGSPPSPVHWPDSNISSILQLRLTGVLLFGAVPFLFIVLILKDPLADYGAVLRLRELPPWWIYPVLVVIPLTSHRTAASEKNLNAYPQMRIRTWTPVILLISNFTWVLYLVAYEFLFRGFLLWASVDVMTEWQAIALNCILYALAHLYKGRFETIGAIPVGILLCYLTLRTGNIWWAVLIHSVMALSNEWFSIRAHPEMHFRKAKTLQ